MMTTDRLMRTIDYREPILSEARRGGRLWSPDGKPYMDWFADVGTVCLGHYHQGVMNTLRAASEGVIPVHSPQLFRNTWREVCATEMCDAYGFDRVFFSNSGSEGIEAAIKIARKGQWATGRPKTKLYAVRGGFHGRSYGAMSLSSTAGYHHEGYWPLVPDCDYFEDTDEGLDSIDWRGAAAVVFCPVYGNNDVRTYKPEFLRRLRERCTESNTALIFDEVQTGTGRTGKLAAWEWSGAKPDILVLGKGIANGFPMAATLASGTWAEVFTPRSHFSTFGGSPLACALAATVLSVVNQRDFLLNVQLVGRTLREQLKERKWVRMVRGIGLMICADIEPDIDTQKLTDACIERGLIVVSMRNGLLRLNPPLNTDYHDVDYALDVLDAAVREA